MACKLGIGAINRGNDSRHPHSQCVAWWGDELFGVEMDSHGLNKTFKHEKKLCR